MYRGHNVDNAAAVGPNAHAEHTTFNQVHAPALQGIDLRTLAIDLGELKEKMLTQANDEAQFAAVGAITSAQKAASEGKAEAVVAKLKAAGKWAADVATKVGTTLAAEALKKSIGLV